MTGTPDTWPDDVRLFRMPVAFGPQPGPRQRPEGGRWPVLDTPFAKMIWVEGSVDAALIEAVLPSGFVPGPDPYVRVTARSMTNIDWLAGRGYNVITVFCSAVWRDDRGEALGEFELVTFENRCEPIISGREDLGWNKVYAEIDNVDLLDGASASATRASWEGAEFIQISVGDLEAAPSSGSGSLPVFHRKYVPATGRWGEADVDIAVVTPTGNSAVRVERRFSGVGSIRVIEHPWSSLPTLSHVISGLSVLVPTALRASGYVESVGGEDYRGQRELNAWRSESAGSRQ